MRTVAEVPVRPQSFKAAARLLNQTPAQVRKALANGEIRTVHWAGREWIPPGEMVRLRKALHEGDESPSEAD